jgi:hypothetical protein
LSCVHTGADIPWRNTLRFKLKASRFLYYYLVVHVEINPHSMTATPNNSSKKKKNFFSFINIRIEGKSEHVLWDPTMRAYENDFAVSTKHLRLK